MLGFDPSSTLQAFSPFRQRADRLREDGGPPRSHIWQVAEPDFELGLFDKCALLPAGGFVYPKRNLRVNQGFL